MINPIPINNIKHISYQGIEGSYSHSLAKKIAPKATLHSFLTFEEALEAVEQNECEMTLIPIENNIGGRVAEMHHLLLNTQLSIVAEYCLRIEHCLLVRPGSMLKKITTAHSHPQALLQCRHFISSNKLQAVVEFDTAVAAKQIGEHGSETDAAIASPTCASTYGLEIEKHDIADNTNNITRFIAMSKAKTDSNASYTQPVTALLFQLSSVPAALYKALGGFATNNINILKLESYIDPLGIENAQFYIEIAANIHTSSGTHALKELHHFAQRVHIIGIFEQNRSTPITAQ